MARGVVTGGFDAGYFFECEVETDPPSDGEGRDAKDATRRTSASKKRLRGVLFSPVLTSQRVTAAGEPTLTLPSYCFPGAMAYAGAIQRVEFRGDENENATSDVFAWEKAAAAAKKRRLLPSDDASTDGKRRKSTREAVEKKRREKSRRGVSVRIHASLANGLERTGSPAFLSSEIRTKKSGSRRSRRRIRRRRRRRPRPS